VERTSWEWQRGVTSSPQLGALESQLAKTSQLATVWSRRRPIAGAADRDCSTARAQFGRRQGGGGGVVGKGGCLAVDGWGASRSLRSIRSSAGWRFFLLPISTEGPPGRIRYLLDSVRRLSAHRMHVLHVPAPPAPLTHASASVVAPPAPSSPARMCSYWLSVRRRAPRQSFACRLKNAGVCLVPLWSI
jgi:hypothetical protein